MTDGEKSVQGPVSTGDLEVHHWEEGARFALDIRVLADSRAEGPEAAKIGVTIEELPPGKQSCPAHYHLYEEEHILILDGEVTLRLGGARHTMRQDDYVRFPQGQAAGHCLINESDAVCRFLIFGDHNKADVAVFTDSDKVMVRGLGKLYDASRPLGYWDGEDT